VHAMGDPSGILGAAGEAALAVEALADAMQDLNPGPHTPHHATATMVRTLTGELRRLSNDSQQVALGMAGVPALRRSFGVPDAVAAADHAAAVRLRVRGRLLETW